VATVAELEARLEALKAQRDSAVARVSYDGQMQRRLVAWRASGESINSLIRHGGELQRARARQLVRSNPYAANASASFTAHAVGCGIKPSSLVEDAALKDRIQHLWLAWTDEADADGLTDFYGLQAMAARAMFEAASASSGPGRADRRMA
jgi:capsid protein